MKKLLARFVRQSPTTVVAMLALFVAFGGTAIAAGNAVITGKQIKNNSITGADVKNKSLTPKDFKGSVRGARGPAGPAGATGATGAKGDKGDKGDTGAPNPNAVDSDKVDGFDANALARSAKAQFSTGVPSAAQLTLGSVTVNAPGPGWVLVTSTTDWTGSGCVCDAFTKLQSGAEESWWVGDSFPSGEGGTANTYVFRVTAAGAKTISLLAFMGAGTSGNTWSDMSALFVPFGSTGTTATPSALAAQASR